MACILTLDTLLANHSYHFYSVNIVAFLCQFTDTDECSEYLHHCEQNCENMEGSYTCSCLPGYKLNANGHTCYSKRYI